MGFGFHGQCEPLTALDAKVAFKGMVMANCMRDIAEGAIRSGAADMVSFGRPYIANPDLTDRFQNDWPLSFDFNSDMLYNHANGAEGYTNFPVHKPASE